MLRAKLACTLGDELALLSLFTTKSFVLGVGDGDTAPLGVGESSGDPGDAVAGVGTTGGAVGSGEGAGAELHLEVSEHEHPYPPSTGM